MNAVKAALFNALKTDSTITTALGGTAIYADLAPQETNPPYVLISKQASTPRYTFADQYEDQVYLVKCVAEGSSMRFAGSVAERIDTVLTDGALTVTGRSQMYLRREADVEFPEVTDGKRFNHSGATYRVQTQST